MKEYSSSSANVDQTDVELAPVDDADLERISGGADAGGGNSSESESGIVVGPIS